MAVVHALEMVRRLGSGAGRTLKGLLPDRDASPFEATRPPELRGQPIRFGPVRILSAEPPVFLSGTSYDEFLGFAPTFAQRYGNRPAGFIIFPTWSIETPERAKRIGEVVRAHTRRFDRHRIRYICNTQGEAALLRENGLPALFLNHKFTVSDRIFRPLGSARPEFDAVYNARFVAVKRHELAAAIDRVAYVAYAEPQESLRAEFQRRWRETALRSPGHALLNRIEDGLPVSFSHEEVNQALNRAATGLILSEVEGASYAAMEYMLAGLPVVSTPSRGGRDVFFDPDYCAVVDPDPRSVREAVAALRARQIPREHIRQRTLQRIEPGRRRFLDLIDELLEELGAPRRFAGGGWPFGAISGIPWDGFKHHLARFERERGLLLERELGLAEGALAEVQMTADELRAVIAAIRARPGGSLLVFGCGHDSPLWETLNAGGETAFVEDNPEWAAMARARLRSATVHPVRYATRRDEWQALLKRPAALAMALPEEIRGRRWDTILVDGPAGYDDAQPGRMQSIYEASRLVAPGGTVFVHDAERPVETAYAARYLRGGRPLPEVRGRAVLRGYHGF